MEVLKQVIVAVLAALILALGVAIWQSVTDGGLVRVLGGATASALNDLKRRLESDPAPALDVIVARELVIRSPDQLNNWPDLTNYEAPRVPAVAQSHILDLRCAPGSEPVAAWHEVTSSHPSIDSMYTIDASVNTENGTVLLAVRARRDEPSGYAYVDVFALCRARALEELAGTPEG